MNVNTEINIWENFKTDWYLIVPSLVVLIIVLVYVYREGEKFQMNKLLMLGVAATMLVGCGKETEVKTIEEYHYRIERSEGEYYNGIDATFLKGKKEITCGVMEIKYFDNYMDIQCIDGAEYVVGYDDTVITRIKR